MNRTITLRKLPEERYDPHTPKRYVVLDEQEHVGFIAQDVSLSRWKVQDSDEQTISEHSRIRTAARVASERLATPHVIPDRPASVPRDVPASWVLIPCPSCNGDAVVVMQEPRGYFDMREEFWYPAHYESPCPRCEGEGAIEVRFLPAWADAA